MTAPNRRRSDRAYDRRHRCWNCDWWDPTPWLCIDCWRMAIISGAGGGLGVWALGHLVDITKKWVNGG